jgi:hypothetical protein
MASSASFGPIFELVLAPVCDHGESGFRTGTGPIRAFLVADCGPRSLQVKVIRPRWRCGRSTLTCGFVEGGSAPIEEARTPPQEWSAGQVGPKLAGTDSGWTGLGPNEIRRWCQKSCSQPQRRRSSRDPDELTNPATQFLVFGSWMTPSRSAPLLADRSAPAGTTPLCHPLPRRANNRRRRCVLRGYQNDDGGFGHGLEPDKRCPASLPIDVEFAFQALAAVGAVGPEMLQRACDFLARTAAKIGADGSVPLAFPIIESFPRAAHWTDWTYQPGLNPTAGLTGLLYQLDFDHPWRAEATRFCWAVLEKGDLPTRPTPQPGKASSATCPHPPGSEGPRIESSRSGLHGRTSLRQGMEFRQR